MTTYTKYHQKYQKGNRNKINQWRVRQYHKNEYGIPHAVFDEYIDEFKRKKKYYLMIKNLNPVIVRFLLEKHHKACEENWR